MAAASVPLFRLIWHAIRAQTAIQQAGLALSAAIVLGLSVTFVVTVSLTGDRSLSRLALPLVLLAWMSGMLLSQLSSALGARRKWRQGAVDVAPERVRAWMASGSATYVDLSGHAHERAQSTAAARFAAEAPDASLVGAPILTGLSASCFGFAGTMMLVSPHRAYLLFWGLALLFMILAVLAGATRTTMRVTRWASERAALLAAASADIERARLAVLRTQMNPRFLFSTLNAVSTLAAVDPPRAERLVEQLSAVLRRSMQPAGYAFTSVDDEVRFVREYLAVEDTRLGARLRLTWTIAPKTLPLRVPTACLRALVEDAIANGVEPRPAGAHIEITSALAPHGDRLELSVEDSGPAPPEKRTESAALTDLRRRLHAEYDEAYTLDLDATSAGARLILGIPARRADRTPPVEMEPRP